MSAGSIGALYAKGPTRLVAISYAIEQYVCMHCYPKAIAYPSDGT